MKIINLTQGTQEWHEWRATRWMASEAAVIMGRAPSWYLPRSWQQLRITKIGLAEPPPPDIQAMRQHGQNLESVARQYACRQTGLHFDPACVQGERGRFAASLDGLSRGAWLEAKSVTTRARWHRDVERDLDIPEHIRWQLIGQWAALDCAPLDCYLAIWDDEHPEFTRLINVDIEALASLEGRSLVDDLEAAWLRFDDGPPLAWSMAANQWHRAMRMRDEAQADLEAATSELLKIADNREFQGDGLRAMSITRRGAVDWRRLAGHLWNPDHGDLDEFAENYRRDSTTSFAIRVSK